MHTADPSETGLVVGLSLSPTWLRGDAWRRNDSRIETLFTGEFFVDAARSAEQSGMHFLFKPDALELRGDRVEGSPGFLGPDPLVLMAMLAGHTERVTLIPTYSSTFVPPYLAARELATLHQFSGGRAGMNVVTSLGGRGNFGHVDAPEGAALYGRADAWCECVLGLMGSVPADAVVADRESGRFVETAALRELAHGPFGVSGPLTVPAVNEARIPVLHAGASAESVAFAGRWADGVFGMSPDPGRGAAARSALRVAAADAGRPPNAARYLPGLALTLAATRELAQEAHAAMSPPGSPAPPPHVQHWTVVGTGQDAVDDIERWLAAGALDGFIALPGGSWETLDILAEEVMPRLAERGLLAPAPGKSGGRG